MKDVNPATALSKRLSDLRQSLRRRNLSGYVAVGPVEVRYLSNFGGEDSWLYVPLRGKPTLLTDFRYAEDAAADCPHLRCVLRKRGLVEELAKVRPGDGGVIGFDPEQVTVSLRRRLVEALGAGGVKVAPQIVRELRAVKSSDEIRCIERALRIAETAYARFIERIEPGMSEVELAAELEYHMRRQGSEGAAFPTICAVGPNASRPHARPGRRRLGRQGLLLVDFGATFGGYRCDLTRMLLVGRIPPEISRAYEAVLEAQLAAIGRVRDGVEASQVDAAARDVLTRLGYGERFGHGTGHGLGLETHEAPAVSPRSGEGLLRTGMVVTIEPGVYLPGRFGIRIEDDVLVTENGCRVLSRLPKDLASVSLGPD